MESDAHSKELVSELKGTVGHLAIERGLVSVGISSHLGIKSAVDGGGGSKGRNSGVFSQPHCSHLGFSRFHE